MELNRASKASDVRKEWSRALRSGNYKQGRTYLHKGDEFCCLGVLCHMAVGAGVLGAPALTYALTYDTKDSGITVRNEFQVHEYVDSCYHLPNVVAEWAGINEEEGMEFISNLEDLNDMGKPFKDIADIIDHERAAYL